MVISLLAFLAGFFILQLFLHYQPIFLAFGFSGPSYHAAVILIMFCSGPFTFFLKPLGSILSRKHEYQADRFTIDATGDPESFKKALLTLHKDNLSNLTPHPLYSFFHYSHPTLAERMKAIDNYSQGLKS